MTGWKIICGRFFNHPPQTLVHQVRPTVWHCNTTKWLHFTMEHSRTSQLDKHLQRLCNSWVADRICLNHFSVPYGVAGVDDELTSHLEDKAMSTRMHEWGGRLWSSTNIQTWGRGDRSTWQVGKMGVRGAMSRKGHSWRWLPLIR